MTAPRHYGTAASLAARHETDLTRAIGLLADEIADGDRATQQRAETVLDWIAGAPLAQGIPFTLVSAYDAIVFHGGAR